MDLITFSNCSPGVHCDGTKASTGKTEKLDGTIPFDQVMQEEEKKLSSEAEALMLALMQKSQALLVSQTSQKSAGTAVQVDGQNGGLMGQELAAMMQSAQSGIAAAEQGDVVGTSQFVDQTSEFVEVLSENTKPGANGKLGEQALPVEEVTSPINLQELAVETSEAENTAANLANLKVESEAKQRVHQAVKSVTPQETVVQNTSAQESVPSKNLTDDQNAELSAKNIDFSKVQIEQNLKTSGTNEPARLAEALPRQTLTQVSEQIEMMFQQGRNTLRLQLTPENLGRIDIRLVNSGQGIGVTVLTEQAETGRLLEAQLNQLRQTLQDAGIQLSHLNVGQHNQGNRNGWMMEQRGRSMTRNGISRMDDEPELPIQPVSVRKESGVDYRV